MRQGYTFPAAGERNRRTSSASDPFKYDTRDIRHIAGPSISSLAETRYDIDKELPLAPVSPSNDVGDTLQPQGEYVQALHDYTSDSASSNVCLAFSAGQYIRVLNKDTSGWWDGQIDGVRGWFPSNYVSIELEPLSNGEVFSTSTTAPSISNVAYSEPMRRGASAPTPPMASLAVPSRPDSPFNFARQSRSSDGVTTNIEHAISLMKKAVDARRTSHFQPATTCLIAAVRSMLSATDCLTRESVILRTHLILARERKQILSILANLVTQARNAASSNISTEVMRKQETDAMLLMAEKVLTSVEHFIQTAVRCGVTIPQCIDASGLGHDEQNERIARLQDVSTPNLDACLQFTEFDGDAGILAFNQLSSQPSGSSKALHKARSLSDVKASRRKGSEASASSVASSSSGNPLRSHASLPKPPGPPQLPNAVGDASMRRPSIPAAYATASIASPAWIASDSVSSSVLGSSQGSNTGLSGPQRSVEVYRALSLIHDQLLSTIAAFVGHVHAHSRASHSSSYAHLIDMARETTERVREALCVIDVIARHGALQPFGRDLRALAKQREALYVMTSSLVTATRNATAGQDADASLDLAEEARAHEQEEEEKQELLRTATGVLRASADCVNATKPLLLKKGTEAILFHLDGDSQSLSRSESGGTETPPPDNCTVQITDTGVGSEDQTLFSSEGNRAGAKGKHTVSMLARKVTSLTCLRDQYGKDVQRSQESSGQPNDSDEDEEDRVARQRLAEWQEQQRGQPTGQRPSFEQSSQRPSLDYTDSARSSRQLIPSATSLDTSAPRERSESSLSVRRGVMPPASLAIHQSHQSQSRPLSFSGMSATSTITSLSREKGTAPVSAPTLPPVAINDGPFLRPLIIATDASASSPSSAGPGNASYRAGGEAMSRDESSRGSAASTATSSFRSAYSDADTADTSPRSSVAMSSPADEKSGWVLPEVLGNRRPSKGEYRGRSGSTPDRLTALRISETNHQPALPSPLSPRPPLSATYSEAPASGRPWAFERDYQPKECTFNANGNVTGGTLACLIERMTLHDQTIDPAFSNTFFLTFRMFTTPLELLQAVIARFNISPPDGADLDPKVWAAQKLVPVRLRVYNFFKTWLESHWRPDSDSVILEPLLAFSREQMMPAMFAAAQRLVDLVQKRSILLASTGGRARGLTRMASAEKLKAGKPVLEGQPLSSATSPGAQSCLPPSPVVSKALFSALRSPPFAPASILDFDALELARQFTLMESRLYCAVQIEELIGQEFGKKSANRTSSIRQMSSLSTRITGWIAEIILSEQDAKKRTALVKYFIKLGDRCLGLQNFNTLMAILAALNSSTIARLRKTWDGLSSKYKAILEVLRKATECTRNYAEYRAAIRAAVAPCLPFLGLYLTDITFCYDGNPSHRTSPLDPNLRLINFDRYQRIAKIVGDLQRFQQPYNLIEVPEIQSFLETALKNVENGGDPQALYRRSLMVEPRQPADEQSHRNVTPPSKDGFGGWRL